MKKNNVIFVDFTNKKRCKKGHFLFSCLGNNLKISIKNSVKSLIKKIIVIFSKYPTPTPIRKIN